MFDSLVRWLSFKPSSNSVHGLLYISCFLVVCSFACIFFGSGKGECLALVVLAIKSLQLIMFHHNNFCFSYSFDSLKHLPVVLGGCFLNSFLICFHTILTERVVYEAFLHPANIKE